jgi:hypothetical protein
MERIINTRLNWLLETNHITANKEAGLRIHRSTSEHIANLSQPNYENNQQDALYKLIYYSKSAQHVSGDVLVHHQEHLTVFTVSGSVHYNNKFIITNVVLYWLQR